VLWGALGVLAFTGISFVAYTWVCRNSEKRKAKKLYESKQKRKYYGKAPQVMGPNGDLLTEEELLTPSFLRRQPPQALLYFN